MFYRKLTLAIAGIIISSHFSRILHRLESQFIAIKTSDEVKCGQLYKSTVEKDYLPEILFLDAENMFLKKDVIWRVVSLTQKEI